MHVAEDGDARVGQPAPPIHLHRGVRRRAQVRHRVWGFEVRVVVSGFEFGDPRSGVSISGLELWV